MCDMPGVTERADRKSYEQVCPMATALDFVGDRWTILIIRELLGGPARFNELRDGLPGIPSNLLSDRLRRMEEDGIARRLESAGTPVYALTDAGARIRTAIEELGIWGARMGRARPPVHQRSIRAFAMALQSILVRAGSSLPHQAQVVELDVDGGLLEIVLGPRPTVTARPALQPDARVAVATEDLSSLLLGSATGGAVLRHVSGDPSTSRQLAVALSAS